MKIWEYVQATNHFNQQLTEAIPFKVWAAMGAKGFPCVFGDQVQLAKDGDFLTISDARKVVAWIADQLGGKVEWNNA